VNCYIRRRQKKDQAHCKIGAKNHAIVIPDADSDDTMINFLNAGFDPLEKCTQGEFHLKEYFHILIIYLLNKF